MSYPADIPCKTNNCDQLVPFYFKDVLCKKCRRYYTGYRDGSYYVVVEMFNNKVLRFDDGPYQQHFYKFLHTFYSKNILNGKIQLHAKQYWMRKIIWDYGVVFNKILPAEIGEMISKKIAENYIEEFMS